MKVRVALTEAYRAANPEAARSFARAFKHELGLLKERPRLGAPYLEGTRRKVFPHFPYSLVYTLEEDLITIHAVAHHSREPEYWVDRLKKRRGG